MVSEADFNAGQDLEQPGAEESGQRKRPLRWYAVQVASGCEKKVKASLEQRLQTLDVADDIIQIEIPQTPVKKVRKDGTHTNAEEKVFPGYVLIKIKQKRDETLQEWKVPEDAWLVIKNTPHVINFVGAEQRRAVGRGLSLIHI